MAAAIGMSLGTNAPVERTTLPSKFLQHLPATMYSSTRVQSLMKCGPRQKLQSVLHWPVGAVILLWLPIAIASIIVCFRSAIADAKVSTLTEVCCDAETGYAGGEVVTTGVVTGA